MIAPEDLSLMRNAVLGTLTASCSLYRKMITADEAGGETETWSLIGDKVPCLFTQTLGKNSVIQYLQEVNFQGILILPFGTDVEVGDKIVLSGANYSVVGKIIRTIKTCEQVLVAPC